MNKSKIKKQKQEEQATDKLIILQNKSVSELVLRNMPNEDNKNVVDYQRIVVPQTMRSIYWKYFGFPATEDSEIVTKHKIVCLICRTQIAYNKNTSNLRMHLQNKHNQELMQLELETPPKKVVLSQPTKEKRAQKRLLKANSSQQQQQQQQQHQHQQQHVYTANLDGTLHVDNDYQYIDQNAIANFDDNMIDQPVNVVMKNSLNDTTTSTSNHQNVEFIMTDDIQLKSNNEEKTIIDAITSFIVMDLQLPGVIEGRGFQKLINTIGGCDIQLPTKEQIEEKIIPTKCETYKERIINDLYNIDNEIGLTIEEWKSNTNESFFTFCVYYQNPDETVLEIKTLSTLHGPIDWDENSWNNAFNLIINEWNLKLDNITAVVVATTREELMMALKNRGLNVVPCLLYTLELCAQTCFYDPDVEKILQKCRAIIGNLTSDHSAAGSLNLQEQLEQELTVNGLVMDYPSIWTTTYNMLEQISLRRNIITSTLYNNEDDNIEHDVPIITDDEWEKIDDLVNVLQYFKDTIMTLSEVKFPLMSLIKPLLGQLVETYLKPQHDDNNNTRKFKANLSKKLFEPYRDTSVSSLLKTATTLDPRFKQFTHDNEDDKNLTFIPIKNMLKIIIQKDTMNNNNDSIKHECEPPTKKNRLQLMFGGIVSPKSTKMSVHEKAELELQQYQSEESASLDSCPIQWWANNISKCPNLTKLARKYNCVPACCIPPSRILPEIQIIYNTQRANLPPNIVDKLVFLHGNYDQVSNIII
ncbi:E3 SUMO-protein ligase ZBED1 [Aphidius gifuensis]|uniref:E3 SUMO-protein ligase ZBED1 n=1 Tax=Aphidius gifuensis TaxID=684658 RepID=UPI001CDC6187|nr:E3 SUMO-protein ligase ZBED1 [Aphidius gifuensis]